MSDFPKIPETWEELESLKDYLADCDVLFLRKETDQKVYKNHTGSLTREEILKLIIDQMNGNKIAILKNLFPHTNLLSNFPKMEHYCIWSLSGELNDDQIMSIVNSKFPEITRWMSMTRREGHFSIPEIWHSHIYLEK